MNLSIAQGVELRLGSGLYRFRLTIHGRGGFLLRVPFLGKAWRYGSDHIGWSSWAEVKEEHVLELED